MLLYIITLVTITFIYLYKSSQIHVESDKECSYTTQYVWFINSKI